MSKVETVPQGVSHLCHTSKKKARYAEEQISWGQGGAEPIQRTARREGAGPMGSSERVLRVLRRGGDSSVGWGSCQSFMGCISRQTFALALQPAEASAMIQE